MHHRKTKVAAPIAAATTITPQQQEEGQSHTSSSSSYNPRRLKLYTPAEIEHCETSKTIMKYIDAKTIQDKNTGITYKTQMQSFAQFVYRRYNKTPVDNFLEQIKAGKYDPYDILTEYAGFLRNERPTTESKLTANVIRFVSRLQGNSFALTKSWSQQRILMSWCHYQEKSSHRKKELTRLL